MSAKKSHAEEAASPAPLQKSPTFPGGSQFPACHIPWPRFLFGEVMSSDETRYVLCGVTITKGNFYATNGRTLIRVPSDHAPVELSAIIPAVIVQAIEAEVLEEITHYDPATGESWTDSRGWDHWPGVTLHPGRVEFKRIDGATISARYIEGTFPDFDKVITERPEAAKYSFSAQLLYNLAKCLHGTDISAMCKGKITLSISDPDAPAFVDLRRDESSENARSGAVAILMPCKPE